MKYLSRWDKAKLKADLAEDDMIRNSKLKPNQEIKYKNRVFTVKYALVIDSKLKYLLHSESGKAYYAAETSLLGECK